MAAGYRSLLGYWAGVGGGTRRIIGPRSMLAFWMGGASIHYRNVHGGRGHHYGHGKDKHIHRDDEEIMQIMMIFLSRGA